MNVGRNYWEPRPETVEFDFGGAFGGGILVEPPGSGCGAGVWDRGFFVSSTGTEFLAHVSPEGVLANRDDVSPILPFSGSPSAIGRSWTYERIGARSLYVADSDHHVIRRIRFSLSFEGCPQPRFVEHFAGVDGEAGSNDGPAAVARFNTPRGIAGAPDGSVYVADSGNHTIRRIGPDGSVTTVAGEPGEAGSADGPARAARLNTPAGIDVNAKGELFIADSGNHTIRMLTTDGRLITIAGLAGVAGYADGSGSAARFAGPVGVKVTADGSLLIADTSNHVIRQLSWISTSRRRVVRQAAADAFESAAVTWSAPSDFEGSIQIRASSDGERWSEWQSIRIDDDLTDRMEGRFLSGILHFGSAMQFVETSSEVPVEVTFFPLPDARPRQAVESYAYGPLQIVSRTEWGCPDGQSMRGTPSYTTVTHAIVHHTAGSNDVADWRNEVLNIWRYHVNTNGWDDVGYNFLIDPNGVIYEGRAGGDGVLGAHFSCRNTNTVGVALLGTFSTVSPAPAAVRSLTELLRELTRRFGLDPAAITLHAPSGLTMPAISAHRDGNVSPVTCTRTECPGDVLYAMLPAIRAELSGTVPYRRRAARR